MIRYAQGNLLEAPVEALVNTVNEVGVMGKGIALMFREAFPASAKAYEEACTKREVRVGHVLVTQSGQLFGPRWIIHFPTKKHWRQPSRLEWVRDGLKDLVRVARENNIRSIALPPLGCGNGGLEWRQVKREIELGLADLPDVDVVVYEPTATYQNVPKRQGLEELTPARALIAELVRRYSVLGLVCTNLEVQKLAWFLQRMIVSLELQNPLDLQFTANKYGPYADRLRHLLAGLDGSYLHCEKRLSDAGPFEPIWFEDSKREAVAEYLSGDSARLYQPALEATTEIIDGFESPLGMELLATVDWLLHERTCEATVPGVKRRLEDWPGGRAASRRKLTLFDDRLLELALGRLGTISLPGPVESDEAIIAKLRQLVADGAIPEARRLIQSAKQRGLGSVRLDKWSRLLEPPTTRVVSVQNRSTREKEYAWIRLNAARYEGQWLAIHEDQLIAADEELATVLQTVKDSGLAEAVLLHFQPKRSR